MLVGLLPSRRRVAVRAGRLWRGCGRLIEPWLGREAAPEQEAREAGWRPDPPSAYCWRCGASAPVETVTLEGCPECFGQKLPWNRVFRLSSYEDPMAGWIKRLKFGRGWTVGPWIGQRLARQIPALDSELPEIVVPVPLHWMRRVSRGYNQAKLIAERFAAVRGLPLVPVLKRPRRTRPQSLLTPGQRKSNVRHSFASIPVDLTGYRVWLVDDVKTTGSTFRECCRLLRKRGAAEIMLLVAAVAGGQKAPDALPGAADE